jgi:outer membrane protein assembly factor BamB
LARRRRIIGAAAGLLVLGMVLSACGAAPVAETWPGLTVSGNMAYVISGTPQKVYILDATSGTQKATFVPQGQQSGVTYWSPVTIGDNVAFVGLSESQSRVAGMYAFAPDTGQELWHVVAQDLVLASPTYSNGVVYFGDSSGNEYAVDVASKSIKPGWPFKAKQAIWGSSLAAGGRLYVASMDHFVYCLDAQSGQVIWKTEVGGAMASEPTLDTATGILYVGAFDGRVYAIQADSGALVKGFDFKAGNWIWSSVLLVDGQLYVTSLDGKLYALDPASGAVIPPYPYDSSEVDNKPDSIRASAVQAGDLIIVATDSGRVIAVKDAKRQWDWPSGVPTASILTAPVVSEGKVYVVLVNGQLQTLDAATGAPGWTFASPTG